MPKLYKYRVADFQDYVDKSNVYSSLPHSDIRDRQIGLQVRVRMRVSNFKPLSPPHFRLF